MSITTDWSSGPEPHSSFHVYHTTNTDKQTIAEEPDTTPSTDGFQAECLNSSQRGQFAIPASVNVSEHDHGKGGFPQKYSVSTAGTDTESKNILAPTSKSGTFGRIGTFKQSLSGLSIPRPTFRSTAKAINNWWLVELAACMVSLSAMLALVLVIRHYDGKPLPKWPLHITIGTYIAVCSKAMSAMLLVPVIESMSQYKWYMYRRTRTSLDTMGLVDNAARGVAGSMSLLLSKRWSMFTSLGALITILAVAIDPCFQQAVQTPPGRVEANTTIQPVIAKMKSYTHPWPIQLDLLNSSQFDADYTAEKPVKAAVYEGLFGDSRKMTASCATGDCQWPNFTSLAVCNRCQDVTELIDSQHSLPNGLSLAKTALVNATTSIDLSEMGYTPWTLLNMSIVSREAAYECSVFWCVKEYNTSMVNGTVSEQALATWSNDTLLYDDIGPRKDLSDTCEYATSLGGYEEQDLTVKMGDCTGGIGCCYIKLYANGTYTDPNMTFKVDYMTHYTLRSFLETTLEGNITLPYNASPVYTGAMQAFGTLPHPVPAHSNFTSVEDLVRNMTLVNIPELMDNITTSITVQLRQAANSDEGKVFGKAYQMQAIIDFHYLWLLYPGLLLLSTFVFLVVSIYINSRDKIDLWKSSPTAILYYGLAENYRIEAANHAKLSELEEMAEATQVKHVFEKGRGWRLS